LSLEIEEAVLEKACRGMIETILLCLPNAFKGTIYRVGTMPELITERITSGIIDAAREEISWGLPAKSEYNPPGRLWVDYRDETGRPLEAMAWCVARQKSWTAEDPSNDARSVRRQVSVGLEDFYHMEPVLVRKDDLNVSLYSSLEYPKQWDGTPIWQDSAYLVVAVIKIHFKPDSIKIGSPETKVIKKLSRSLGTELLSYQLRKDSMDAMQDLARDRLNACNILADSLRNAITKSGLIFSLVKQEIGYLREQWENILLQEIKEENPKTQGIKRLSKVLDSMDDAEKMKEIIQQAMLKFLDLSLPPEQGEKWLVMQIEDRWRGLMQKTSLEKPVMVEIEQALQQLKSSLEFGKSPRIIAQHHNIPEDLKAKWVELIYNDTDRYDPVVMEGLISILGNPDLKIPSQKKTRKSLIQLKALADTMNHLERNTNFLLHQVLNGKSESILKEANRETYDEDFNFSTLPTHLIT